MTELVLASRRCDQCLTTARRIVPGARAAQIIKDCRAERNHFFCHKGDLAGNRLHCRGVHEIVGGSRAHDFAQAFDIPIREVNPDSLEQD
jgi:hypothetical protein